VGIQQSGKATFAGEALPVPVRSALWFGHQLGTADVPTVPSGFPALDAELPGGGWPLAGLTELLQEAGPGGGELALLAAAQARAAAQGGEVVWIAPPHTPCAPALQALGMPLERFLWLAPADPKEAAWAAEQVLRSGTCAWVQWWSPSIAPEVLRRLHLAALDHHCPLLLLRPAVARQQASPAPLRLACTPLPRRHLEVRILKRRGSVLARAITLALPDPAPHRPGASRSPAPPVPVEADVVAGRPSAPLAA
jgi:protein ImuA